MRLMIVLAALSACTSFDAIDRDTCGNGLLETGEDCDSSDATCIRCAVTCDEALDCPTADYTCGIDGFCHAPGGALSEPRGVGAFEANDYRVTDLDNDQIGDAVGVSRTSIVVRFGDAAAPLSRLESQVTPSQTGAAAFGYLDDDASLDLSMVTADGLVSYTSPYGRISPLDVQSEIAGAGGSVNLKMVFSITPFTLGGFVAVGGMIQILAVDFLDPNAPVGGPPCGQNIPVADFNPDDVDVYYASRDTDLATDVVVSVITGSGTAKRLCVIAIHKASLLNTPTIDFITPANAPMMSRKPVLADLTNDTADRCPALVNTDGGVMALRKWDGTTLNGHCALKLAVAGGDPMGAIPGVLPGTPVIGHAVLDPPVGVAPDMLVLGEGLFAYMPAGNAFSEIYRSTRKISHVLNADLDGDGDVDVALSADGQDDIDLLLRYGLLPVYQLYRIDTASELTTITVDDFDADSHRDIAYTERVGDHQRLMIAYGTADRPLPSIEVGTFADVASVARVSFADSADPLAQAADLIVLLPGNPSRITALHGSPQRTMIAFFDPRSTQPSAPLADDSVRAQTIFRATAVGRFATTTGSDLPDIIGLAAPTLRSTGGLSISNVRGWTIPGTTTGLDGTLSDGVDVLGVADCATSNAGSNLCIEDANYLAWPLDATRDAVIAIDHASTPHVAVFDPRKVVGSTLTSTPVSLSGLTDTNVRSMHAVDLTGDGVDDFVAAFSPTSKATGTGVVLACQVDAAATPTDCVDLVSVIAAAYPETVACIDAAPGRFGYRAPSIAPTPGADLIVLCRGGGSTLYRVSFADGEYRVDLPLAHVANALEAIRVGDVTGDGVDDVVGLEGNAGARALVVFSQCTSLEACAIERLNAAQAVRP